MTPLIDCKCRVSGIGNASRRGAPGMPCLAPAMQQHDRIAVNLRRVAGARLRQDDCLTNPDKL
jgi:hypothetical protein